MGVKTHGRVCLCRCCCMLYHYSLDHHHSSRLRCPCFTQLTRIYHAFSSIPPPSPPPLSHYPRISPAYHRGTLTYRYLHIRIYTLAVDLLC